MLFRSGFVWKFDYQMSERFHNSLTRSSVMSRIPFIDLALTLDLNADTWADLFAHAGTDDQILSVVLTLTDGVNSVTITHPEMTVMNPSKWADVSGVDAITDTLNLRAWLKSGSSDIVTIVYA